MMNGKVKSAKRTMESLISVLLRAGVGLSALLLLAGMGLAIATGTTGYGQSLAMHRQTLSGTGLTAFPTTLSTIASGVAQGKPFAIIGLGTVVLIATPIARVAASMFLFLYESDLLYTAITTIVLAVLLFSLLVLR